ncbi:arginase family protein [Flagellimonas sp. HMM57]|uniref:arginase family protein n=1 Tax=unclassified Flagellimonas TaxID=2644544 RepID=UPI0013D30AFC|nr:MULTISPECIES: arginase family protein [unclassified Flagellimonas]UII75473.1 arginase family protein [Flagellimonas sp. HMM57]
MKIYFPQWQGSGNGVQIEAGAKTILDYLNDPDFVQVPLSTLDAGKTDTQKFSITNYDAIVEQLTRLKQTILEESPSTIQTIGGDCGLEIVPVSYLNQKYPDLGVIWFDAHADINRPCESSSCNFHGMPLRTLLGEGEKEMDSLLFSTIQDYQIHYVGLRNIDEKEKIRLEKGNIYHPIALGVQNLVQTLQSKNIKNIYLHFDFDCLEPSDYNKTYYQVSNGIKIKEAEHCIATLKENFNVVGTSILESITENQQELEPIHKIIKLLIT